MTSGTQLLLPRPRASQTGFTLVEIMVGLVIGMLATIVIMQAFSVFEGQKRTTTGTADAQVNGSISLFQIGRDLQMAGFGLIRGTEAPLECTALTFGSSGITSIDPVAITDGASDSITIHYGSSPMGGVPASITAAPLGNNVPVDNSFGCQNGDVSLAITGTSCDFSIASTVVDATTIELKETTGAVANAHLACLGTWNEITYAVNNGNLERNGEPSVPGIINLQAQYGVSATAGSNQVTQWVDPTGATWAAPTVADRNRIKAVRIAVVARNPKTEPDDVTTACSSTTAAAPTGLCAWEGNAASPAPAINLVDDADGTRWQRYRYRVFETVIPLRNVIWTK